MNPAAALIQAALSTYGEAVTLNRPGGARRIRAIVQPVTQDGAKGSDPLPSPLGLRDTGRYLYVGPPDEPLEGVTAVLWGKKRGRVLRHELFSLGGTPHHMWALLELRGEESL